MNFLARQAKTETFPSKALRIGADFVTSYGYYVSLLSTFGISVYLGAELVQQLRVACITRGYVWRLASVCYIVPVLLYIVINTGAHYDLLTKPWADATSLGTMLGIIFRLTRRPSTSHTVRILVRTNKRGTDPRIIWLKSTDTTAKDAIAAIGAALNIVPLSRISVETGKGGFITGVDQPLLSQICVGGHPAHGKSNSSTGTSTRGKYGNNKDFFGFTTGVCNIVIRDEEVLDDEDDEDDEEELPVVGQRPTNLTTLIAARGSVRWKNSIQLKASVLPNTNSNTSDFTVSCVNNYAAAAPPSSGYLNLTAGNASESVRFVPFTAPSHDHANDGDSDARSEVSAAATVKSTSSWGLLKPKAPVSTHLVPSNAPVCDGDTIVIASSKGQFMSIRQGWWMSWSEDDPRRSGAFRIEIIERAPQIFTNMARSIGSMSGAGGAQQKRLSAEALSARERESKESSGSINTTTTNNNNHTHNNNNSNNNHNDNGDKELRTGDLFLLRSVKFPEYELGITSKHIEGDYCYLGLHKAQAFGVEENENVWCHSTRFTATFSKTMVF